MSRHGKSKGKPRSERLNRGKSPSDEPVDTDLDETSRKAKGKPPRPQKSVVAAEATGALPREDVVRQEPAPPPLRTKAPVAEPESNLQTTVEPESEPQLESEPESQAAESPVETLQRSFQAARLGSVEVNRLLMDIGRRNLASSFDFSRSLAAARTPIEAVQLQLAFFDEQMKTLLHQAEELRALSAALVARANEPIREHMRRSFGH